MNSLGWLASLTAISGTLGTLLNGSVQNFWGHHPVVAVILTSVLTIVAHFAPSPVKPKVAQ